MDSPPIQPRQDTLTKQHNIERTQDDGETMRGDLIVGNTPPVTSERASRRYINMSPAHEITSTHPRTLDDLNEIDEDQADDKHYTMHSNGHDYANDQSQCQQLSLLRNLLHIERANNEKSRANNAALKIYIEQLQTDFLRLQSDMVEALEFGHKLKVQKDSQIATIEETVREKDGLIEQLRTNIANLNEPKLRQEFDANLEKQRQLAKLEQDQLRQQVEIVEQQLAKEEANQAQATLQFQEKIDEQKKLHEKELATMCSRLKQTQDELEQILSEPQNLILKALKEDKSALECRADELEIVSQELQTKYDNLKKRLEILMIEQEQSGQRSREELDQLQQQYVDQRRALSECKLELEDKQEIIQILQFNLQRSEKRVKNLLGVMKNKEETYRSLVAQMELKHQHEVERVRNEHHTAEKLLIENGDDLSRKHNELVRARLEHENQLESMRNDRDVRLNKMILEKQSLEKELKATELRLAREIEQTSSKSRLIEHLQEEVKQFRDESKRLSIELTKSEAKLYAKQQELNKSLERLDLQRANSQTELCDSMKMQQLSSDLDEEKRLSRKLNVNIEELKKESGKLNIKLRIAEANLDRVTSAINREHGRMMREYEKKLEQIRSEQITFDKNKLRYKRYGYKLKKYCEHLKRVHEHLCNPSICGYILGPLRAPAG